MSTRLHWPHVATFLGVTFGLTWLLNLLMFLNGGLGNPGTVTVLQFQMLLPATCGIVLSLWFFPESPLFHSRPAGHARWFYYYFLLLALIFAVGAAGVSLSPNRGPFTVILASAPLVLSVIGLIVLVVLRISAGRQAMASVWLAGGNWRYWLGFGVAMVAYYALQAALNAVFNLGGAQLQPPAALPPGTSPQTFALLAGVQAVLLGPFIGLVITFGEEFGWRGYLQTELFKIGRRKGVVLLGVIWGAWHWPLILMGYNYPGHPLLGVVLMTLYTMGLAVVLGYSVLRSGSVLLSSFLHALNNQVVAYLAAIGFRPHDNAFSFMIGTYGIVTLAIVAVVVVLDPIWRGSGSSLMQAAAPEDASDLPFQPLGYQPR